MTQSCFRNKLVCRLACLSLAVVSYLAIGGVARAVNLVQEFYLPMPEAQINQANNAIVSGTGSTIASTFSIVVTADGTVIYYDQWEDGYETDLSNPTQSTTQIWGDGNDAHGIPPGFAHNPLGLPAGTVITLTNNVTLPRNPATILWDARDRIAANKALVISRAAWPIPTGPVFAGAVGVLSTMDYGTNYISPVGQNMTNGLMKYVGLFIMAAQDNTAVTIDPNGNGVGTTNIVLNQGESYLVNGEILKGGRVTATKPIQADLIIGHVGATYASDWFTLYPVSAWDNSYYTPVGTSASGNPAYVYLFNPGTNAITINYNTRSGSGSFAVPGTNGVFQFQMPVGSGASFTSAGGQNFFAICTVGANPASDTAYNWGFTLVPKAALTTAATVGWGPGSADGTVDGSPVWVTALGNTILYVDYKGDSAGPLTDPNGNKYDTNFTLAALQSQKIYDPSKNQTGMRVYTVDGTLITAAWGEDPDVAAPGNPYIDAGTTVLPFPMPVLIKSAVIVTDTPPAGLSVGDTIAYTVQVDNKGLLPLGNTVVIDAPSTNLLYLANSTTWNGSPVPDSTAGTAFPLDAPGFTIPVILSQGTSTFTYLCKVTAGGVVSNSVNIGGSSIYSTTSLVPAPTNGASVTLNFSDTNGVPVSLYSAGANVFVTMTNAVGNTSSNSVQTIAVTVVDQTHGDLQTITLIETGTNTGVFRNLAGLPTSTTAGLAQQDGILNVTPGDTLSVSYTDPTYGDSASNTAAILIPALTKQLYLSVNGSTNGTQDLNRIDPFAYVHSPTRTSVDLGAGGAVALDSVTTVSNTALTATFSHTTSGPTNRLMLVGISLNRLTGGTTFETPTNVTYAGVPLTLVGGRTNSTSQEAVMWLYALINPLPGTANVVVNWDQAQTDGDVIGCATFTGVNQSTPYGSFFSNTGTSTAISLAVNSAPGEVVFDTVMLRSSNFGASGSPGASQSALWKTYFNSRVGAGASTQPGAASVTNTWTSASSVDWAIGAISIKPAAGGGSTNVTAFTQTQGFCSNFVMPSNNFVYVTNYITVTNGVMPASPAVTATLQYNGTNILTLANPTYSSANSNLVWSGVLTSNVMVPAGQLISYVISNGQSGVSFHIDYDSTNKPSKIVLPASTVIAINTLGVYDAPYPGGNLVTTPVAGSPLFVRANVSDPFGSYDITSLGLAITAPTSSANVSTNLNDASVVMNDGCAKTYEYAWNTGPVTGSYAIAVTANEGTEGVTASAGAGLSLIFLDLGTPSTTEFTAGANGVATNSYPANGLVSVRVTDLNRNTNATTVDTITATITSSGVDSEFITLTETGVNTGIFTNSILSSTNAAQKGLTNNFTLFAPVGSILTVSYSDPTDPTDNTSATATITPLPGVAGVVINKTLVFPSGGQVGVGQPVTYNLQIVNTGSTALPTVVVTDNFPSNKLSYSSASLAPTSINAAGVLTWTNLGAMTPGQNTNITVTFATLATGNTTNAATADGGTATNSSSATVLITHAALNVGKILLSPTNTPVVVGSNVVFRITVQNTGNTVISTLPLEDNFSGAYYQFVAATIPPNGSGAGSLVWTNLAWPTPLATNAIITNDVTMKVVGQGNPANNTAVADYAVDIFGTAVPASSTTTGVVTSAASIIGHVYNDINHSGVFTNGDAGLSGVTLQLFTDPNGDGNPADGTLVQIVTSDANGDYELLNLTTGHYVVEETDLPGYASSAPANGRLALNLTTLTVSGNNNFFQYQPTPTSYSTISGTVWNDVNGNGTNDPGETGLANVSLDLVQDLNTNGLADAGEPVVASVLTDVNGNYSFAGVTPGNYVIRETDLYGYYNTGDAQPPNDGLVAISATGGATFTNIWFLQHLNQPPVATNDLVSVTENVPTTIYPLANDADPDGNPLTITAVTTTNGTVNFANGTNVLFTPATNFLGPVTLNYSISDGHGGSASANITVLVTNNPPVANPDSFSVAANTTNNVLSPLLNDLVETPGGTLSIIGVSPTNGTAGIIGTNVVFTPGNNFLGVATIGYVITDNVGGTNRSLITVTVTNVPPVANPDNYAIAENTTNNFSPLVNDLVLTPGGTLAIIAVDATNGTATISGTNVIFTPTVNFLGVATIGYVITDNVGGTNSSGITVTVTNIPPLANLDSYAVSENSTNTFSPLANDVLRTPGGTLSIISVSPTNGTASIAGTNVIFTPANNFRGTATIGYTITDNLGGTNSSLITVTVTNVPPLANPDNYIVAENSGTNVLSPLLNDVVRTPGGTLTIVSVSATNGTALFSGTNVLFAPATNFFGMATIGYTITDNVGGTNTSLITVNVTNVPPVANPDSYGITENTTNSFSPLVNDLVQTPGGNLLLVSVSATNGTATISGTNVIFVPATNFLGLATIGYTITDNVGGTNRSLISAIVTNLPPAANPDNYAITENTTNTFSPLVNDVARTPGGTLTIIGVSPTNGTTVISGTNILFAPATNFVGTATIGYTIIDNIGGTNSTVITVTVTNIPPVANPDSYTVSENSTNTFSPLANDVVQTLGGNLALVSVSVTNGMATIFGTNVIYSPANNFTGTATVDYTITDGIGGTNSSFITVSVTGLADIAVSKTGPATVFAATNFDYTITVTNLGPGMAVSLSVTDALPAAVGFVSATPGATLNGSQLVWANLGSLAVGAGTNLTVTVTAPFSGGSLTNLASGGSPTSDPNPTNNTSLPVFTTVIPVADLAIGKTAAASVFAASNLSYTISVTNFGPSSADNVVVTDSLPVGATFVNASGNGTNDNGVVNWNLGTLTNGEISSVTLTVTAPASGSLTNVANVSSPTNDPNPTNNVTPPVVTEVTPLADVSVSKTGPAGIIFGTNFSYTISVTNFGPSTAAALVVTDSLPTGLVFLSSIPATTTNADNQVIWSSLGDLAAGAGTNLTVNVISAQLGSVTNIASGGSPTLDPVPTNNVTPPVVTAVTNNPPVANPDSYAITENTTNIFSPLDNDVVQTPGGSLSLLGVAATNGVAVISGTNIIFTPAINFLGLATIGYTITDNVGGTNSSLITVLVTNIPPVANPDSYAIAENTTNSLSPLMNDLILTPGGSLSLIGVAATNGTATISGTNVIFTPANNFLGTATIGYTITDGIGGTNSSLIMVLVTNIPPVANPDSYAVAENTTNSFSPLANDLILTPGGSLSLIGVTATNGTATISGTNLVFTPTLNFLGIATIGYTITDGIGGTNSSIITVTVTNIPPVANPDSYSVAENTASNVLSPLVNDLVETPGGTLSNLGVSATNGTASISGTNVLFTPATNFLGVATIGYTITDGIGGTNSSLITVLVTNIPPVANTDNYAVTENTTNSFSPLVNDLVQTPGGNISLVSVSATNGTATISGTNVIFLPATNFLGVATIGYTITDNVGGTNSSLISVIVTNLPPAANPDSYAITENTTNTFSPLVNDVVLTPGGSLTIIGVSPTNGTATISGTNVIFTPAQNFLGLATIGYTITDGIGGTNSSLIAVLVTNIPPVANPDAYAVSENSTNSFSPLVNDLIFTPGGSLSLIGVVATNGTATISGTNVIFTPANNFIGTATIGYTITDGIGGTNSSLITVAVTNVPPLANPDNYAIAENTTNSFSPLLNDVVRTPGGVLSIVSVSATNGMATIAGTNVVFTPANNFLGIATIGYTITDNVGGTNRSLITVTVTNVPPVANPDNYAMTENTTNTFSPLVNDLVQTPGGSLTIIAVNATNGTASISGTNVIFTPTENFLGTATIGYVITDNVGGTNSSVITVLVTNIPPAANPDSYTVSENSTNTLSPLVNDVLRTPGGTLSIIGVSPTNGTATISGTNVIFTPANNFIGTATIGYTITDNIGGTNSSLIMVTVTNVPPLANPDNYIMAENSGTNVLSPLVNDVVRTPGGILAIVSASATNGTALVSGTNVLFAPATNFFGVATIGYTITDNVGGTNTSLITVNVTNVPPVANGQSVGTTENTAKVITLTGTDPNHLPLTFAIAGNPANGTLSLLNTNTGAVTYTPNNNFTGADSFTFRVNNGQTNSVAATVSLTVTPVADLAVAQSGPASGLAGSNLVFTVSVTNRGPATATNIVVTNQLASGFTFVSASASGTNVNNFVTWFAASLPANGVTNFTVTAFAAEGGAFTNIASGASAVLDLNPTNNNGSLANAQSLTVITAVADLAVFKDGGTNVFASQPVSYVITATNAGPSTASNVVVQDTLPAGAVFSGASGSYAVSNGVVTWNALTLAPGTTTSFNLTLVAPASVSSFVNIASGMSTTTDPNPTNNNGSFAKSRVTTKVAPSADLVVLLTGPATAITGSNFVYNLVVTNAGPSTASNVVVSDSLPTNLVFISASSGGLITNNVVTWPLVSSLALGASTNYTITVKSPISGLFTNIASAFSSTFDPNPTNNSGVAPASQAQTTVALPQFSLLAGKPVLNPQTGLFEESVVVTNSGSVTVAGIQLYVSIQDPANVSLYNATGTNSAGVPYVQYNSPIDPGNTVGFVLEFYSRLRNVPTNTLSVIAIIPPNTGTAGTNGSVLISTIFTDTRTNGVRFVIEFGSVPGKTYTILYSSNLNSNVWQVATPSVTANANITQWYDDGPPKTVSPPATVPRRFYRVIQN